MNPLPFSAPLPPPPRPSDATKLAEAVAVAELAALRAKMAGPSNDNAAAPVMSVFDFVAFLPSHDYIFRPTGAHWPKESLNTTLPQIPLLDGSGEPVFDERTHKPKTIAAAVWLDRNSAVHQETWAPGEPAILENQLVCEGGFEHAPGRRAFNLYRPSKTQPHEGDASPWLNHLHRIFNEADAKHIIEWGAHRVQKPGEKCNYSLVIGGPPGVGKDTTLEPLVAAIGTWNFGSIRVRDVASQFNEYVRNVVLRISEVHDLGESGFTRYELYEALKIYQAAPPSTLRVNGKHRREHHIANVVGLILTTNHKSGGMYLPADDRRHYVAWAKIDKADFEPGYFERLYTWFGDGGNEIVAHYLGTYDLSHFNPKATPPKTAAFWEIVGANVTPEDAAMADALDRLSNPDAVCMSEIRFAATADPEFHAWLNDSRNRPKIPHRLEKCDYVPVRNEDAKDGHWRIADKRQPIYARKELSLRDQFIAAQALVQRKAKPYVPPSDPPPPLPPGY